MSATGVFLGCGLVPHLWSSSLVEEVGHHYPRRAWGRRRAGIMLIWRWWMLEEVMKKSSVQFSSVQFSHSVMFDSLWSHESQHARPPCPSPTPRVHSDSHPLSQWCYPAISSSVVPFSSCPKSLPAWESFPMSPFFASGGQSIGVSASASVLPVNIQDWISFRID